MKGQVLKILFNREQAFLTSGKPITLRQTNLPEIAQTKGFKSPAYWIFKVINHLEDERRIFGEVISYHIGYAELNYNEHLASKLNNIETITFKNIDTGGLFMTLDGGTSVNSFIPTKSEPVYREERQHKPEPSIKLPYKQTLNEMMFIPIKEISFVDGGVSFYTKMSGYNKLIEFKITNLEIKEEFDAVKNYFANVLKTKRIQVNATVELIDSAIKSIIVSSPEIDKINKDLIDKVKINLLSASKKKVSDDLDKSLFTMEEYFETFVGENVKPSTFYNDDEDFFSDLLSITDTKHYKHLRYLSNKHAHDIVKLRYIPSPFSFIFILEGVQNYYIVWETLNTAEATYVWQTAKDINALETYLIKIDKAITNMKDSGKRAYVGSTEDDLIRIRHDYSDNDDGFLKWKGELDRLLTQK